MADDTDMKQGVMVCLYPPIEVANRHALPGGEKPEDMHVTLAYLGHIEDVDEAEAREAVRSLASARPFVAKISGHARFTGDEQDVLVALVDSPAIERLRRNLIDALAKRGIAQASEHGYTPHMTLAYMDPQALAPVTRIENEDVPFASLWLVYGTRATEISLGASVTGETIRSYARTAYAQGWAASGGPMTERVHAGCIAAMELCVENWEHPDILEVAIHLGQLEGIWATVFERRHRLFAEKTKAVRAVWQRLVADVKLQDAVYLLRQQTGLQESSDENAARFKAAAKALFARLLEWLPGTTSWQEIRDAMRDVVAAGQAEGYTDAIAVAASEADLLGLDFDLAFQHAYDALANLGSTWAEADTWLARMVGDMTDVLGRTLGALAAEGASYEDMLSAAEDLLGDTVTDEGTVGFIVDWAMSTGMSRGALDLYRSEGVEQVTWMTAGDGVVCPVCEKNGMDSPFPINDFPDMPAHPRCRCVASADFTITPSYGGFFV